MVATTRPTLTRAELAEKLAALAPDTPFVRESQSLGTSSAPITWARAEGGVLGRASERVVVRGVELLPSSIEEVVRRHPAVREFALSVYRDCQITVELEADAAIASEGDRARVAAEVSEDLKRSLGVRLQCEVEPPGSLGAQDAGRRARRFRRR